MKTFNEKRMKIKFFVEEGQTHCYECGEPFQAEAKQFFLGTALAGGAGVSFRCPIHNYGTVATLSPDRDKCVPVEVEVDLAGSRRKTEEALRQSLLSLNPEETIKLLAEVNTAVHFANQNHLKAAKTQN